MKKILNISEMKQVRGGAQISSMCGEGEKLYFWKNFPVKNLTVSKSGNPCKMGIFLTIMLIIFPF